MQSIFPTTYSTLCAEALAKFIAASFGLTETHCQLILRGVGDTYELTTAEGKYILRVYRSTHRSKQQIEEETAFLLALQQAGVPAAYPVMAINGAHILELNAAEGLRHAVLFDYARGKVVNVLNEEQLTALGLQTARMHDVAATMPVNRSRWTFDEATTLIKPLQILQPLLDADTYAWYEKTVATVSAQLAAMDTASFSYGICHYDLLPKNFHFDGNKLTFFDFDFMGYGWLINDLMTFRQQLLLDVIFGRSTAEVAERSFIVFMDAYKSRRPLSAEEEAAIPLLAPGFWLFYSAFHTTHDQFYPFIHPAHLSQRFAMVRRLLEKQL
jgi:Ser/Thr protein kinase RdoA (MazF antagonist)